MGLLDWLFRSESDLARELSLDEEQVILLWSGHIENWKKREALSKFFNYGNVENAIRNPGKLIEILGSIEELISRDITDIDNEEKLDEEILRDLEILASKESTVLIDSINEAIVFETEKQKFMRVLLIRIRDTLKLELHLIKKIKTTPNAKNLLSALFRLIFHVESDLNAVFMESYYREESKQEFGIVKKIVRAVLLEQRFNEDEISAEIEFVREAVSQMGSGSKNAMRKFAERIFDALVSIARKNIPSDSPQDILMTEFENLLRNDGLLRRLAVEKKGEIELPEEQILWTVKAFRRAYRKEHFDNLFEKT